MSRKIGFGDTMVNNKQCQTPVYELEKQSFTGALTAKCECRVPMNTGLGV